MRQQTVYILEHYASYDFGLQLYTLRYEQNEVSLAADFFSRITYQAEDDPDLKAQLEAFYVTLDRIDRRKYSLLQADCLRDERQARALPPEARFLRHLEIDQTISLRLYCYPAGPRTLILFNGDVKTHNDPTVCPQVGPHFRRALKLVTELEKVADQWDIDSDGFINWDPPELIY